VAVITEISAEVADIDEQELGGSHTATSRTIARTNEVPVPAGTKKLP